MGCRGSTLFQSVPLRLPCLIVKHGHDGVANTPTPSTNGEAGRSVARSRSIPPPHNFLTPLEESIVLSEWDRLNGRDPVCHQEMGLRIFLRIFELEPRAQQIFGAFRDVSDHDQLVGNATFRIHAARFMRVIVGVMDNIDNLDVIVTPNLIQLGRVHRQIAGDQIRCEYFDAFERAMSDVWTIELRRRRSKDTVTVDGVDPLRRDVVACVAEAVVPDDTIAENKVSATNSAREESPSFDGLSETMVSQSEVAWRKLFRWIAVKLLEGYNKHPIIMERQGLQNASDCKDDREMCCTEIGEHTAITTAAVSVHS